MKTSFVDSFNKINENFGKTFAELFGGGTAQVVLTDPDDVLSSGIEIIANPAGKKIKSLVQLSGGEQQRVGLARALVNKPSLIIADEPTGNVDPNMSYEIVSLLTEINKRGTTILMVTHDHNLVRDFQHRVIMLDKGKIVADNVGGDI